MKKRISLLIVTFCMLFMMGCNNRVDETTMYYSMVTSPADYYIRLEKDGDFMNNAGLHGTYTIKDDKVTFLDSIGGKTYGYLVDDKYMFYVDYSGNENKIPDSDTFDVVVYDGIRTTITFKADGTMEKHIYQENIYDYKLLGEYEREGKIITCTFGSVTGETTTQTFGVYDGVLYEVLSSDKGDFTETQVASMDKLQLPQEDEVGALAVIMMVVVLIAIFAIIFFLMYKMQKIKNSKSSSAGSNSKKK